MSKPRPIYKPGTTRFAGSIGEGRDTLPGALAPTASAPVAATPAPALSDLLTVLRFRTSATGDQAPTAQERAVAAAAVTDWFAACTRDGDSAVWWNARSGHWQAVAEDGVQAVWIGSRFDYATEVSVDDDHFSLTLEGGETLTCHRVRGVGAHELASRLAHGSYGPDDLSQLAGEPDILERLAALPGVTVIDPTAVEFRPRRKVGRPQEPATDRQRIRLELFAQQHGFAGTAGLLASSHAHAILGGVGQFDTGDWVVVETLTKTQASCLIEAIAAFEADTAGL